MMLNGEHIGTNLPTNHCHALVKNQHKHLLEHIRHFSTQHPEYHLRHSSEKIK
jgi:hypothetical protein